MLECRKATARKFFFGAFGNIPAYLVTGVLACVLPILMRSREDIAGRLAGAADHGRCVAAREGGGGAASRTDHCEIGRASCRERGQIAGAAVLVKQKQLQLRSGDLTKMINTGVNLDRGR